MSVIFKSHNPDVFDSVFIFYDFEQVEDAVLVVTFVEETNRWQKVFVYNKDDKWETENLKACLDNQKFEWLCKKLNLIFQQRENSQQFGGIDIDREMKEDSDFMLGFNQID